MRKSLLLDADVLIDLHSLGLFQWICKSYHVHLTRKVLEEVPFYKKQGAKYKIDISADVTIIESIGIESLGKVQNEAKEARLGIDPGESASIAYIDETDKEITFCTCDKAAIKLISYMNLEERSISVETALRNAGYREKNLYPRHLEKSFKECIKEGKALRIQFKRLV
jgi:hypothetical protein